MAVWGTYRVDPDAAAPWAVLVLIYSVTWHSSLYHHLKHTKADTWLKEIAAADSSTALEGMQGMQGIAKHFCGKGKDMTTEEA